MNSVLETLKQVQNHGLGSTVSRMVCRQIDQEVQDIQSSKRKARGSFDKGIWLERVEDYHI